MKTDELREMYLAFFETKDHARRPSDVLVPTWDSSVLFTPAGMNQFKDHFLGRVKLDFTRATTCQKCLRTGDIDNVGRTAYHHTFFEMLGNFSFGDYFKREAIIWAWEFLTDQKWLAIDRSRLTVSVYKDDEEAAGIWADDVGVAPARIARMEEDENFWPASAPSQGPDGVCGPCSEIFYHSDDGSEVEIWNLVFTQFNRVGDPPDNLRPLPSKNIDTGMGLERTAATLQGHTTNFHIDILRPIVDAVAEACGTDYEPDSDSGRRLRRITDHLRACTFAIHENVYPGPNKEKYVIRRLLRRAVLDGYQMGVREPFLHALVPVVVECMKQPYPELVETAERVANGVKQEETNFFGTIDRGYGRIEAVFAEMQRDEKVTVDPAKAADLYQTYGVPPELMESLAAEKNFAFDWEGFRKAMEKISGGDATIQAEVFKTGPMEALKRVLHVTEFVGYETTEADAVIKGIIAQDQLCDKVVEVGHAQFISVVLDRSPFYAEAGGQVGDTGEIVGDGFKFRVSDAQKDGELIRHVGHLVEGEMVAGAHAVVRVDADRRQAIRRAHSATHVLHHALRKNLGQHAQQQGSKVDEDWLRFDFTNLSPVDPEQLDRIEADVNERIAAAQPIRWQVLPLNEARQRGAMMLFGEKYPDPVRMVSMGEFSHELCGGTHLDNTSEVGSFDLVAEEGVAAGTRRVVALTGTKAEENMEKTRYSLRDAGLTLGVAPLDVPSAVKAITQRVRDLKKQLSGGPKPADTPPVKPSAEPTQKPPYAQVKAALREAARTLNVSPFDVPNRIEALSADVEQLEQQLAERASAGELTADGLIERAEDMGGVNVIVAEAPGANPNLMRQLIDQCRRKIASCAVLLATKMGEDKVTIVAGVTRDIAGKQVHAGNWVRDVAKVVGGGGGGKPDMAQAGGKQPEKLPQALEEAKKLVREML
jgi:alanyl-tRNA synthetase